MGCASSKQKVCENCRYSCPKPNKSTPRVPRRSKSMHVHVHHLPENRGDSYHLVSLTSSTLGSLRLDPLLTDHCINDPPENVVGKVIEKKNKDEFVLVEAKTWSKMIEEKIPKSSPKTPTQIPLGEPETINAWELMEGLEDTIPPSHLHDQSHHHLRSLSFNVQSSTKNLISYGAPATPIVKQNVNQETSSMVQEVADHVIESNLYSDSTSIIPEFDTEVISTLRNSLQDLPPATPFHLKPLISETGKPLMRENDEFEVSDVKKMNGIVEDYKSGVLGKEKLVLYFTSLRGVRKTYEDCCAIRVILKGLGVKIDERDISMHLGFKEELKELLGEGYPGGGLPKLFIGTRFIGGSEEIRQMNEAGQLDKLVERCEKINKKTFCGGSGGACEACDDIRFMPCDTCSGSCKIFCEGYFDEEDEYGFQRCPNCNENGLIRCPVCCD